MPDGASFAGPCLAWSRSTDHEPVKDFNPSGESMTGNPQGNPFEPEQQIEYEAAAATTRVGLCLMRCSEPPFSQGPSSSSSAKLLSPSSRLSVTSWLDVSEK
jgi:hypothetical protein